ncbi:serine/threonine-protein kinase haspin [Enteropsectra breve]|nr:serine/threonine-protein kinase haspin [Enteropsectra breve]
MNRKKYGKVRINGGSRDLSLGSDTEIKQLKFHEIKRNLKKISINESYARDDSEIAEHYSKRGADEPRKSLYSNGRSSSSDDLKKLKIVLKDNISPPMPYEMNGSLLAQSPVCNFSFVERSNKTKNMSIECYDINENSLVEIDERDIKRGSIFDINGKAYTEDYYAAHNPMVFLENKNSENSNKRMSEDISQIKHELHRINSRIDDMACTIREIKELLISQRIKADSSAVHCESSLSLASTDKSDSKTDIKHNDIKNNDTKHNDDKNTGFEERNFSHMTTEDFKSILNLREVAFSQMPKPDKKLAEASFSEVFVVKERIYKIIPFTEWYGETEFCKECGIMKILKEEDGVAKMYDYFLIRGKYPASYLKAWESFENPENDNPEKYESGQLYGCIVMENCGKDLEAYVFANCNEITRFLVQLIKIVGNLETKYNFEHRDLHWGNIMIKTDKVFLIDFSLSRLELDLSKFQNKISTSSEAQERKKLIYTDLAKEDWIFQGNAEEELHFAVYRKMKAANNNTWEHFNKKTNEQWLLYVIKQLRMKSKHMGILEKTKTDGNLKRIEALLRGPCGVAGFDRWNAKYYYKLN